MASATATECEANEVYQGEAADEEDLPGDGEQSAPAVGSAPTGPKSGPAQVPPSEQSAPAVGSAPTGPKLGPALNKPTWANPFAGRPPTRPAPVNEPIQNPAVRTAPNATASVPTFVPPGFPMVHEGEYGSDDGSEAAPPPPYPAGSPTHQAQASTPPRGPKPAQDTGELDKLPDGVVLKARMSFIKGANWGVFLYNTSEEEVVLQPDQFVTNFVGSLELLKHNMEFESDRVLDIGHLCEPRQCCALRGMSHVLIGLSASATLENPELGLGQLVNSNEGTGLVSNCKFMAVSHARVFIAIRTVTRIPPGGNVECHCAYDIRVRRWKYLWDGPSPRGRLMDFDEAISTGALFPKRAFPKRTSHSFH